MRKPTVLACHEKTWCGSASSKLGVGKMDPGKAVEGGTKFHRGGQGFEE